MATASAPPGAPPCPPLTNGDRLSRAEFHRRYELHPELRHVELVEGVVYMPSPIRLTAHGEPQGIIVAWLYTYAVGRPEVRAAAPATVLLDSRNEPEPDAMLFLTPEAGGRVRVNEGDYVEGAPELVAEIAASSASYDLGPKMRAYRRNGVREYIVWQIFENRLDWFSLEDGEYRPLPPDARGVIHSKVFPGLRLAVPALLARDLAAVLKEQQRPKSRTRGQS